MYRLLPVVIFLCSILAVGQNVVVQTLNNIQFADQFPGADAGAKINNAIAAAPIGGVVDCRGFTTGQTAAQTVLVNKSITLLLGSSLTLSGNPGISVSASGVSIVGQSPSVTELIQAAPGTNLIGTAASGVYDLTIKT